MMKIAWPWSLVIEVVVEIFPGLWVDLSRTELEGKLVRGSEL